MLTRGLRTHELTSLCDRKLESPVLCRSYEEKCSVWTQVQCFVPGGPCCSALLPPPPLHLTLLLLCKDPHAGAWIILWEQKRTRYHKWQGKEKAGLEAALEAKAIVGEEIPQPEVQPQGRTEHCRIPRQLAWERSGHQSTGKGATW